MTDISSQDCKEEKTDKEKIKIARGKRLSQLRGMSGLSRLEVGQNYGISQHSLKNWELGRQGGLTTRGAKRVLTVFRSLGIQCSVAWLLNGVGSSPVFIDSSNNLDPMLSELSKGYIIETGALPAEIKVFCDSHPHASYMQVMDDGMEPYYSIQDYVAGETYYEKNILKAIGVCCIVQTQQGETLLRFVRKGVKEGYYSLCCVNIFTSCEMPVIYDAELVSAAPVVLHLRKGVKNGGTPLSFVENKRFGCFS